ncbi:hypothetical protein [Methylocella sp. CPCC 101449]|uniref:hypothetical protein n=1 Tax=Methylocella sp. CPCC 101449 TaxID=2987531 RepID=UPI0028902F71|nr:hypothetical protein [Methylocella sp. CPCC 101449]MDT2024545.1 hypothetical protein [Methylocella sp. CPCC 101449]
MSDKLSNYPFVIVRLRCNSCGREGQYRLARLAHKFGPEIHMQSVLELLTEDCGYHDERRRGRYGRRHRACHAYLPDLRGPPTPPDLPPGHAKLRLIKGGKTDKPEEVPARRTRKATP